jgi:pilus assembly protein CpaE
MAAGDKKTPVRVAVVDLNFQGGTLADFLDLEPRLDIAEVISHPERLDEQLVDIFASRHSSSLDVFSSPARTIKGEQVGPRVVFALLDQLGKRYDLVLLDILHHWLPWVDNVLQGSDAVIITGGGTVPAVKQLANRVRYVENLEIPSERIAIVVNQCEMGLFGQVPRKAEIDRTFPARQVRYVPLDLATATLAANTGRPMVELGSRKAVSKSIRQLVNWIQTVTQPTELHPK